MTEERKHAILLATVILTARRLQPLLEEDDRDGKPNMGTEFWAEAYTKKSHILGPDRREVAIVGPFYLPAGGTLPG
jgi:hypothetical protein